MTYRLLLDTSSLTYRAFFALPLSITDPAGRPVNAVRGYLDMTARLITERQPDEVLHVFDADWRPAERVAAYPGYKSERAPDPDELPAQFELLYSVLQACGQACIEAPGWEADDALGVLCCDVQAPDRVDIVTGDRDLIQLVRDPAVRVLYTLRGVTEIAELDEAGVLERHGIPARRYVDYAILRGDPSDGLPGVKGVGEKTARQLVTAYDSLDALLDAAGQQTPRLAERLLAARSYLEAMRAVVPVRTDVAITRSNGALDIELLDKFSAERNLEGPIRRLQEALGAARAGQT